MGLYDAMNASVTGMAAQSNYLTNVGQNIANSGTAGYKQADTEFSTLVDEAGVGQTSAGGVMTSTRLDVAKQGTLTGTSSSTDLAVSGNGFFVVSDASGQQYLTRARSFVPDKNGDLVNAAGYYLNGYSLANGAPTMAANSLAGMQIVNVNSTTLSATPTTTGTLTANLPSTDSAIAPLDILFGLRSALAAGNHYMAHKCGFTAPLLTRELMAAGFASVAHLRRPASFNLWAVASESPLAEPVLGQLAESHPPN